MGKKLKLNGVRFSIEDIPLSRDTLFNYFCKQISKGQL